MKNKNRVTIGQIYGDCKAMGYKQNIVVHGKEFKSLNVGPKVFEYIKDLTPEEFCATEYGVRCRGVGRGRYWRISGILCTDGHFDRRKYNVRRSDDKEDV